MKKNNEPQIKDFLERSKIRTMRKDLKALRERDLKEERKKISKFIFEMPADFQENKDASFQPDSFSEQKNTNPFKLETSDEENNNRDNSSTFTPRAPVDDEKTDKQKELEALENFPVNKSNQKTLESILEEENHGIEKDIDKIKLKTLATEQERQNIFLLENQQAELRNQIQSEKTQPNTKLILSKNQLLMEQKSWQKKLDDIILQEQKNEEEKRTIIAKQTTINVPYEKEALEKQLEILEEKGKTIEKQRWSAENELQKINNNLKQIEEEQQLSDQKFAELKAKEEKINKSLKAIYSEIQKRQNQKQTVFPSKEKSKIIDEEMMPLKKTDKKPESEFLKDLSDKTKEKLAKKEKIEKNNQIKFIEEVEMWAQKSKNQQ